MPYFLSDDPTESPDFADWNGVYVPYCSQDVHSGQVTQPSAATFGLYFSGHLVFAAILDALEKTQGLGTATEIILTGCSAGGIGVWLNVDYLAQRFPKARVSAVTIAGFYFYAFPYTGVNHTSSSLADFRPAAWPVTYALWDAFADQSCVQGRPADPWACMLSNNSFPWISTPSFAIEAQTDQVVLTAHDWVPSEYLKEAPEQAYLTEWHANMTQALAPLLDEGVADHGAFNPACFIHGTFDSTAPLINGRSYVQALGDWYFQRTAPSGYKLADTCGIMCNPTCPTWYVRVA